MFHFPVADAAVIAAEFDLPGLLRHLQEADEDYVNAEGAEIPFVEVDSVLPQAH